MRKDFKPPQADGPLLPVPPISEGASSHILSNPASAEHLSAAGFPDKLPDDWKEKTVARLGELADKHKSLKLFMDLCVKCGACTDKCQFFLGTSDPKNMPAARQELLRKIYRRYFTAGGKVLGKFAVAEELSEETLKEWSAYFYQCSECRRCAQFCPFGIDTAEFTMAARELLHSMGRGQRYSLEIIGKVHETGNNLGIPKPALKDSLRFMEEDVKEETGVPVKFPLDEKGADVLLAVPSADFYSSPHVESLAGYAKVFHAAGVSYTFSSYASEVSNFGLFIGSYDHMRKIAKRVIDAARELKVRKIVVGECGHAWRAAYSFWDTLVGPLDFLEKPCPQHICEFTLDIVDSGAIQLDSAANDGLTVTYHDPCNVARASRMGSSPGGQFEIPRRLLKASCSRFVEMHPETVREKTFCCGGGGGLLTDELMELRVKGAAPRMAAYRDVVRREGVNALATICATCKAQFTGILPDYDLPADSVKGVLQLVGNAVKLRS
jgi:Fe-S oxidoreductase